MLGPEFYERFKIQILTVNFNTWHNLTIWKVERQIGYYLLYGLLPSMICVVMSWAGFWIKLSVPPARVGLCITTYLSLKTLGQVRFWSWLHVPVQITDITQYPICIDQNCQKRWKSFIRDIPKVPYIKIIDIWMFACESLVFMTLMEFTIAQVQFRTVEIFRDQKTL